MRGRLVLWIAALVLALSSYWWLALSVALACIVLYSAYEMILVGVILDIVYFDGIVRGYGIEAKFTLLACLASILISRIRVLLR